MSFTAPCFSGECGFCSNCCDSKYRYKYPENIQRAYDLKKFMGKQKVHEETDYYHKSLNKIMETKGYYSPNDYGYMKENIKYEKGGSEEYTKYKLMKNRHKEICDDPLCKIFYISAHENHQLKFYPNIPLYSRVVDNNHFLCAVCIDR